MKNSLSILITLTILLSGSSMASLNKILGQFSKLESYYNEENNLCGFVSICSHLDEIIANNNAMPKAWVPQRGYENESQLKNIVEIISEQELRDCLSQLKDDGQVKDKLFMLKDHEYYHYILFHTVMGLRCNCSTDGVGKDAVELQVHEDIFQDKINQLTSECRCFEKRSCPVPKYPDISKINIECEELEWEEEQLLSMYMKLDEAYQTIQNSVCPSVLLYTSKGDKSNLNCTVYRNGDLIRCRHLAVWWLKSKEFKYGAINSEENLSKCKEMPSSEDLTNLFNNNGGCPSEGIYFELSNFPKVIYDVAISLPKGQEKRYLLNSNVHAMGLCIKKNKYNNIIIYFYDPNYTLVHKKIITKTVDDLKYLIYQDLIDSVHEKIYFPWQDKVCCIVSLDKKDLQKDCKVVCMNKPSAALTFLLSFYGHYGHSAALFDLKDFDKNKKKEIIEGCILGFSALRGACAYGHLEAVSALISTICSSDLNLSKHQKAELIAGARKNHDGDDASPLYMACQCGYSDVVTVLVSTIYSSHLNLSNHEKAEFLTGKYNDGVSALYIACEKGYSDIVAVLVSAIYSSHLNLSNHEKAELLAGKGSDGASALYIACQKGYYDVVTVLISAIYSSVLNLSKHQKTELIAGKSNYKYPPLHTACDHGHPNVVTVLVSEICSSDLNLSNHKKAELLAGKSIAGKSALYTACMRGHRDVVIALIDGICRGDINFNDDGKTEFSAGKNKYCFSTLISAFISTIRGGSRNLSKNQKAELLAGKSHDGYSALFMACQEGYSDVVTVLVSAICSSDLNLSKHQKVELIAGESNSGCPALHVACESGNLDVVTVLVSAICSSALSLSQSEKDKLLAGKDEESGVSALERARALGHDKIVEFLRNCGM